MDNTSNNKTKNIFKMIIFTLIGLIIYVIPFKSNGEVIMFMDIAQNLIIDNITIYSQLAAYLIPVFAVITLISSTIAKGKIKSEFLNKLFEVKLHVVFLRLVAGVITLMVLLNFGPEQILSEYTGGLIVDYLVPVLLIGFVLSLVFITFLTDFGGLELIGGFLQFVFKPLFKISGNASVMAIVAYFGSGTGGMILTDAAYKKGEFTKREGALIVLCFSVIAFPFAFIYPVTIGGLEAKYFPYVAMAIAICVIVSGIILMRIPPISRKPKTNFDGSEPKKIENVEGKGKVTQIVEAGIERAGNAPKILDSFKSGLKDSFDLYVSLFPSVIVIATGVLVLAEYTPVFDIIAIPFTPILELMGMPEASAAAPAFLIGFADLLLPFILATTIHSQLTKFVVCVVGIVQLYCMSEGGIVLLNSSFDIKFKDLVFIFILKTVISIPIAFYFGIAMGIPA